MVEEKKIEKKLLKLKRANQNQRVYKRKVVEVDPNQMPKNDLRR